MLKLFKDLKPYRLQIAIVVALTVIQSWGQLYLPNLMSDIVDQGILQGDTAYIWKIGGFMLAVTALVVAAAVGGSYLAARTSTGFGRDLRQKVFTQVHNMPLPAFDELGTATLITRTTNDIVQVQQLVQMGLRMMLISPIMMIGGVIMAVGKDARLSLILLASVPAIALAVVLVISRGMPLFTAMQQKLDKLNRVARENLTGMRVIRAFDRTDYERERFGEANLDLTDTAIKVNRIMAVLQPVMSILMNFSIIAIIWFGAVQIDQGTSQIGDLMAFIQYVMQILFSLVMLSMIFIMVPRAQVSAARINEVLAADQEDHGRGDGAPSSPKGRIQFRGVSFRYPGAEEPVLSDLTFTAEPGKVTAIIGSTGAGKTTLVNLIPRFFEVEEGSILLDGVDIRQMPLDELRALIGYVPQKAVLFSGTVAENLRYGNEAATDEELAHAARIAQAAAFIGELDEGYDSPIAQGGTNLSGGQKQRLTIARALVRKPLIYIFDDNFSALDFKTDARLRAELKPEIANSTVFLVAQRVSTIMDADQILVLDEGRIVGQGSHEELMQSSEVYQQIVASQLSEEEASA